MGNSSTGMDEGIDTGFADRDVESASGSTSTSILSRMIKRKEAR